MGLCETWITEKTDPLCMALDESAKAPTATQCRIGYAGVAWIMNPLLQYRKMDKYATLTIQFITVKVGDIIMTVLYVRPRAAKDEELFVFNKLNHMSGSITIVMGNQNARLRNGIIEVTLGVTE